MLSKLVIIFLLRSKRLLISWLHSPSAVIREPQNIKSDTVSPSICHEVMGPDATILVFWMLSYKPTFSHSSFTVIRRLFSSSLLSAIRVTGIICISEVIDISPGNLDSSSPGFHMMYSAFQLNKQGDNIQLWSTPFPVWNQFVVPYLVLTVASWPAYTFPRRQLRLTGILICLRIVHSLLWSTWSKVWCN